MIITLTTDFGQGDAGKLLDVKSGAEVVIG
jgi:hypothetical protein